MLHLSTYCLITASFLLGHATAVSPQASLSRNLPTSLWYKTNRDWSTLQAEGLYRGDKFTETQPSNIETTYLCEVHTHGRTNDFKYDFVNKIWEAQNDIPGKCIALCAKFGPKVIKAAPTLASATHPLPQFLWYKSTRDSHTIRANGLDQGDELIEALPHAKNNIGTTYFCKITTNGLDKVLKYNDNRKVWVAQERISGERVNDCLTYKDAVTVIDPPNFKHYFPSRYPEHIEEYRSRRGYRNV